jgi:UDP-N-acetyl-D-galactosamine dehydrogenase
MAKFIAEQTIKNMIAAGSYVSSPRECAGTDIQRTARSTQLEVADVLNELKSYGVEVFAHDPPTRKKQCMSTVCGSMRGRVTAC